VSRVAGRADPGAAVMKALYDEHAAVFAAKDGGAMMAALRPIWAPVGPEFQMAQGDWRETKTALQPVCVAVGSEYLIVAGNAVSS
jgi:hypothetical protein